MENMENMEEREERKESMCHHRDRQVRIVEVLRAHGGVMDFLELVDLVVREDEFTRGEAVMALIDSPPSGLEVNQATGRVALRELVNA